MPFIDRDAMGKVGGIFNCRQHPGQEHLPDDHPELVARLAEIAQERAEQQTSEMSRAEKLRILAEYLRTAPRNVQEAFADAKSRMDAAEAAFLTLKGRYDKLENWAKTKGYVP